MGSRLVRRGLYISVRYISIVLPVAEKIYIQTHEMLLKLWVDM